MKRYEVSYMHQSIKQKLIIEASSEHEAAQEFKRLAPDVPEGNILSVVDLSRKEILIKKMIVSVVFTLIGLALYMYFERGVFAAVGGGFLLIGIGMLLLELLAIYKLKNNHFIERG